MISCVSQRKFLARSRVGETRDRVALSSASFVEWILLLHFPPEYACPPILPPFHSKIYHILRGREQLVLELQLSRLKSHDYINWAFMMGFPGGSAGKESACNARDLSLIPGLGRSPGEGNGYPLQYSGLEKSMDYTVKKSQAQLSEFHFYSPSLSW